MAACVADHCPPFHYPTLWEGVKSQPDQRAYAQCMSWLPSYRTSYVWGREAKGQPCQPVESNVTEEGRKAVELTCVGEGFCFAVFLTGQ